MRKTGSYEQLGDVRYFIPYPLPPHNPFLQLNTEIITLYGQASFNIGKLNETAKRLPDAKRFIRAYVIKEALLSSAIEGIHTTLLDVFTQPLFEEESKPNKETQLVLNYTKALDVALTMIQDEELPIVSRVILQAHKALMQFGEGDRASPGQYRKQEVRVGDLVPPLAHKVPELITDLEKYINIDQTLPPIIKAGLAHVQFETIHPFLDGNGRIGRLLIVLMLIESNILSGPILYPSYYFKKHRFEYYQKLDSVRTNGDFEGWITYYLTAIRDSSQDAYYRAQDIETLEHDLQHLIETNPKLHKMRDTALQTLTALFQQPIISVKKLGSLIHKSYNTAYNITQQFIELGLLSEDSDQKRSKFYRFDPYLRLLEKDYDL